MIAPAMEKREEDGKAAYNAALDDDGNTMTLDLGKGPRTVTFKTAVAAREQILAKIAEKQAAFYDGMTSDDDEDFDRAVAANLELARYDAARQNIDDQLYAAMGSDAKFYLSKQKLAEVSTRFGTATTGEEHEPPARDDLEEKMGILEADKIHQAVKKAAT